MTTDRPVQRLGAGLAAAGVLLASSSAAQVVTWRGSVEGRVTGFVQQAPNDPRQMIGDALWRHETVVKPAAWLQVAAGLDGRLNTYDQVEREVRLDVRDRRAQRPLLSLRRLSATLTRGPWTVDVGKQFIRWGTADIVTPTDRFAPRDFLNVVEGQFLPVTGARLVGEFASDRIDVAVVPWLTPSRAPLLTQRWTVVPPSGGPIAFTDVTGEPPTGAQVGARWVHRGAGYEFAGSVFDGFNTLPNVEVTPGDRPDRVLVRRIYPRIRTYGLDGALPARWFTLKGEVAYFTSDTPATDEYALYVVEVERQTGEWLLLGGYAGEAVTVRRSERMFAPDRGLTRAFVGRLSRTIDVNRSVAVETAVRQNGAGAFVRGEYSQARGAHWRTTVSLAWLGGASDDFLGQYRRNSHASITLRYSY